MILQMMSAKPQTKIIELPITTPDGQFVARYSEAGLCGLEFPSRANNSQPDREAPPQVQRWHALTSRAVAEALAGQPPKDLPPLDLSAGTDFQQRVWCTLVKIGCGQTWSYGQVAQAIGNPKALRAVGGACGANPIPLLVPCHRVLAANRRIGGFSGGMHWKRTLLQREGSHWEKR
jgi:O-6-methylguanine DNA methyltransferase